MEWLSCQSTMLLEITAHWPITTRLFSGHRRDRRIKKVKNKTVWVQFKTLNLIHPFVCVVVGQCCCLRWTKSWTSNLSLGWFTLLSNWHKTAWYSPIPSLYWIPMRLCGCLGTHERTSVTGKQAKCSTCRHLSTQSRLGVSLWWLCRRFSSLEVNSLYSRNPLNIEFKCHHMENQLSYQSPLSSC